MPITVTKRMRRIPSTLIVFIILIPLAATLSQTLTERAEAASACTYEAEGAARWHHQVSSFNLTDGGSPDWFPEGDEMDMDEGPSQGSQWDSGSLFSSGDNIYNTSELKTLRSDFFTSLEVKNDTTTGLRVNLTSGYRYTFCFVTHSSASEEYLNPPMVDFYLVKEYDWELYRNEYSMRQWNRDMMNMVPPEWRDVGMWIPYRDVHAYEGKRSEDFAVSLDHDETSGGALGLTEEQPESLYLLVDGWDNIRDTDTPAPHRNFTVDITIMTEQRLSLPNFTVALVCCGLFSAMVAAPVIAHHRFQTAGSDAMQGVDLMPMLETEQTK